MKYILYKVSKKNGVWGQKESVVSISFAPDFASIVSSLKDTAINDLKSRALKIIMEEPKKITDYIKGKSVDEIEIIYAPNPEKSNTVYYGNFRGKQFSGTYRVEEQKECYDSHIISELQHRILLLRELILWNNLYPRQTFSIADNKILWYLLIEEVDNVEQCLLADYQTVRLSDIQVIYDERENDMLLEKKILIQMLSAFSEEKEKLMHMEVFTLKLLLSTYLYDQNIDGMREIVKNTGIANDRECKEICKNVRQIIRQNRKAADHMHGNGVVLLLMIYDKWKSNNPAAFYKNIDKVDIEKYNHVHLGDEAEQKYFQHILHHYRLLEEILLWSTDRYTRTMIHDVESEILIGYIYKEINMRYPDYDDKMLEKLKLSEIMTIYDKWHQEYWERFSEREKLIDTIYSLSGEYSRKDLERMGLQKLKILNEEIWKGSM